MQTIRVLTTRISENLSFSWLSKQWLLRSLSPYKAAFSLVRSISAVAEKVQVWIDWRTLDTLWITELSTHPNNLPAISQIFEHLRDVMLVLLSIGLWRRVRKLHLNRQSLIPRCRYPILHPFLAPFPEFLLPFWVACPVDLLGLGRCSFCREGRFGCLGRLWGFVGRAVCFEEIGSWGKDELFDWSLA